MSWNELCRLRKLRESKATLERFNKASTAEIDGAVQELHMHCELLKLVKKDLDSMYGSIRQAALHLQ
jgi:hypothetical protein